jgi:hypothetical protein
VSEYPRLVVLTEEVAPTGNTRLRRISVYLIKINKSNAPLVDNAALAAACLPGALP